MPSLAYDCRRYQQHELEIEEDKQLKRITVNTRDEFYSAMMRFASVAKRTMNQLEGNT